MALSPTTSRGFNGGTITSRLAIDPTAAAVHSLDVYGVVGDADSQLVVTVDDDDFNTNDVVTIQRDGTTQFVDRNSTSTRTGTPLLRIVAGTNRPILQAGTWSVQSAVAIDTNGVLTTQGGHLNPIASGALPTVSPVTTTPFRCSTTRDVSLVVPFTGDGTNNPATLQIELSPDNITYAILDVLSIAAALNLTGAINLPLSLSVPAGWWVKLTSSHGTIGTGTYY